MTFLPIVERELRVQARQKRTYRLRLANAAVAMALVSLMLLVNEGFSTPGSLGHGLFTVLGWLAFIYCLLSGAGTTADCLSEEKRQGTMGLLFLTDLKGYDVVLGKLLATSLNNLYGLTAIFPPLAITFCLGGVTAGEFWRLALLLTTTLFFSLALGMFVSALSWREQRAWARALALLLVLGAGPVMAFLSVFDVRYGVGPGTYWKGLLAIHGLSWVLLGAASVILPRAWQVSDPGRSTGASSARTDPTGTRGRGVRAPFTLLFAARGRRRLEREDLLLVDPVIWLADREAGDAREYLWVVVLLAVAAGLSAVALGQGIASVMWGLFACALGLHFLLAIWAAFLASHLMAEARSSGTLELLLATPLRTSQVIEAYFIVLKKAFIRPIGLLLAVESAVLIGEAVFLGQDTSQHVVGIPLLLAAGSWMALFISDLFAVGRFGLWMGVSSKKPTQAFMKTVLYVLVLPLFLIPCCTVLLPFIGLVKNAVFINYAEAQFRRHYRMILTEGRPAKAQAGRLPSVVEKG